jgi:DNA polymerase-3 subunit epsilon
MTAPTGPPPGWRGRSWREADLAALDFEATGLDSRVDEIVSFGVVPVHEGRAVLSESSYREVAPSRAPGGRSVAVHELRSADLALAPPIAAVRDELASALAGRVVLAWVADVEIAFLRRIFGGSDRAWRRRTIDVWRLSMAVDRAEGRPVKERRTLAGTCVHFGVPVEEEHHALDDALMTAEVFLVLASRLEARGMPTLQAIAAAR